METSLFRTIGKHTFYIIECAKPRALNMLKKIVFLIPLTTCILPIASKRLFEIRPFSNPRFSGGNTAKLRVIFLHTNAALEVQNRVQFAWAKSVYGTMPICPRVKQFWC